MYVHYYTACVMKNDEDEKHEVQVMLKAGRNWEGIANKYVHVWSI